MPARDNACYASTPAATLKKITRERGRAPGHRDRLEGTPVRHQLRQGHDRRVCAGRWKILNTMRDLRNSPVAVAVSESTSTVAVANTYGTNSASVSVYVSGAKTPTRVLSDSGISKGYDIAFDHKGNCYLMGYSAAFSGNNTDRRVRRLHRRAAVDGRHRAAQRPRLRRLRQSVFLAAGHQLQRDLELHGTDTLPPRCRLVSRRPRDDELRQTIKDPHRLELLLDRLRSSFDDRSPNCCRSLRSATTK